jgi:chromosome segregation ATPase
MAQARHVELARELEEQDERVADAIGALRALEAEVAEVRAHAEGVDEIRAGFPFEQERLHAALEAARAQLAAREAEEAKAEAELARARESEEQAARRAVTRARDATATARRHLARTEEQLEALERAAARAEAELPRLQERARGLGRRLEELPRVTRVDTDPSDLPLLLEWGSRARAALFVATGGLETERDRIVREANELGAAVLGEAALAASVASVRERIERAAADGRG